MTSVPPALRRALLAATALVLASLGFVGVFRPPPDATAGGTRIRVDAPLVGAGQDVSVTIRTPGVLRDVEVFTPDGERIHSRAVSTRDALQIALPTGSTPGTRELRVHTRWLDGDVPREDTVRLVLTGLSAPDLARRRAASGLSALAMFGFAVLVFDALADGLRALEATRDRGLIELSVLPLLAGVGLFVALGWPAFALPVHAAWGSPESSVRWAALGVWALGVPVGVALLGARKRR